MQTEQRYYPPEEYLALEESIGYATSKAIAFKSIPFQITLADIYHQANFELESEETEIN